MSRKFHSLICCISAISSTALLAPAAPAAGQTTPSAFVYVTSNYSGSNNRVVGYSADSTGKLTQISGSPWADNISWMVANGKYLFGSDNIANDDYRNIYRYQILSNGALKYLGATDIQTHGSSADTCNQGGYLTLDHTGQSLYQDVSQNNCNEEQAYQAWSVNSTTSALSYLSSTGQSEYLMSPMTFTGNNQWAYAIGCNFAIEDFQGFKRESNGALTAVNVNFNWPTAPPTQSYWTECLALATADPGNHMAVDVYYPDGEPDHIATYTVNTTTGDTMTNSTYDNTPPTAVGHIRWMSMAPSGRTLAVGGDNGLQLFSFYPWGQQVTVHTGLLTTAPIDMVSWDNSNHIYAISNADSRMYVFTYGAQVTQAPGSPYVVSHPLTLFVQPK
jgi:hypothetical protein